MSNEINNKKLEPCPPLHRRYPTTGKCELLKVYQLKRKSSDKNSPDFFVRLMPQSLRELLSDEIYEKDYVNNKDNSKIEIYKDRNLKNVSIKKPKIKIVEKEDEPKKIIIRRTKKPKIIIKHDEPIKEIKTIQPLESFNQTIDYKNQLYPLSSDNNFSLKIAKHKEFNDTKYDGTINSIKEESNKMCNAEFELMPHQNFVKNFLSFNTPYNSLFLYHGLGSGKTCSSIGVSEEMRTYMKQVGIKKKIIIIASPNVQDNFKLQLFDERKLIQENGVWKVTGCVASSLLKEINPSNQNLSKQKIISQIKFLINQYYLFMGYTQFANFIELKTNISSEKKLSKEEKQKEKIKKIKSFFDNRLIIIDEVHNIRITNENNNKRTAELLMELVKYTDNMRLLLLSATPMYNSYEEIIWITNLMNLNDKKDKIISKDIFNSKGEFTKSGKDLLIKKLTGYISYVRGENPYLFPIRIYADNKYYNNLSDIDLPTNQLNNKKIKEENTFVHFQDFLFYNDIGEYQNNVYKLIVDSIKDRKEIIDFDNMDQFGYTILQKPIEALNIVYPNSDFDITKKYTKDQKDNFIVEMIGKTGLNKIMKYQEKKVRLGKFEVLMKYNFEYKNNKFGRIFSKENLHKYSSKMAKICDIITKSNGIILIYSQFIDGGVVPMALALEEMGFTRFSSESYSPLLKTTDTDIEPIDSITFEKKSEYNGTNFKQAKYMMITGDKIYSPNNVSDIKYLNEPENKNGENVKVVIISKAAAEGIDFKNIRQVHILEPWYNLNRIEQIIGRGVRNLSHCLLPFEERNVEIFLHCTLLDGDTESTDLYIYRLAEKKSIKIGKITRILKETSVDCILNIEQSNFTFQKLNEISENKEIMITLPNGNYKMIEYGDKPYTNICDYMDNCEYKCNSNGEVDDLIMTTYNDSFLIMNNDRIIKRIKDLFKDIPGYRKGKYYFKKDELINSINITKKYPNEQIYSSLDYLTKNKNEFLIDNYGRLGNLINKGDYYIFQPVEIIDEEASIFERERPVDVKIPFINFEISDNEKKEEKLPSNEDIVIQSESVFDDIINKLKTNFENSFKENKITVGEKDWYLNLSQILDHLKNEYDINKLTLEKYVVYHYLDTLSNDKKIVILNRIYNDWEPKTKEEVYLKAYFDEKIIDINNTKGIVVLENNVLSKVYNLDENKKWKKSEYSESIEIISSEKYKNEYIINFKLLNDIIGFFALAEDECVFKIRDITTPRNKKGARLSQQETKDIVIKLNQVFEDDKRYFVQNIKNTKLDKGKMTVTYRNDNSRYSKNNIVVLFEIILRNFEDIKKNNKIWFLTNEKIVINKVNTYVKN